MTRGVVLRRQFVTVCDKSDGRDILEKEMNRIFFMSCYDRV